MSADPRGYYAALHLTPEATQAEIQRAFRALVRLRHPDVGSPEAGTPDAGTSEVGTSETGLPAGADDVRAILAAFAVLRNPLSRAAYDGQGRGSATPGSGTPEGSSKGAPQDIPVRHHRTSGPVLRVSPVRWERGPWEGRR